MGIQTSVSLGPRQNHAGTTGGVRGRQEGGGSETLPLQFGHEQLDIYRVSPEYAVEKVGRRMAITTTTTSTTTNALVFATFAFFARGKSQRSEVRAQRTEGRGHT
ncbi:MAG: hypothetical protein JRK53_27825 [Deltaproteobacteria bacterium]|nr:hypothetical protein [Deltaproteobacteria bacterium]